MGKGPGNTINLCIIFKYVDFLVQIALPIMQGYDE